MKIRHLQIFSIFSFLLFLLSGCANPQQEEDVWHYALSRKNELQLSTYLPAGTVIKMMSTEAGRRETLSLLKANGISKVYVETYRSGTVVPVDILKKSVNFFKQHHIAVVGGIATVPGDDFGVKQDGVLGWFNWQNEKTQDDVRKVIKEATPVFDSFIIDDFFCTSDTSEASKAAKGDRSWSEYRRSLLTRLAKSVFIDPAKEANPNIQMIIKFPQWYDRFHLFGYDLTTEPALFDQVWAGTETRGQYTQRYGFVQPYEGFINYKWISSLSEDKLGGAWFDHLDCTAQDYADQAYQSVLAGAKELTLFNFNDFIDGHPGNHLLRQDFEELADLAAQIAQYPIKGPAAYKPANSDAGGDLYIMDFIGMLGIPLIPYSQFPDKAKTIFLPTQAAADSAVVGKALKALENGSALVLTTGFLQQAKGAGRLARLAGINWPMHKNSQAYKNFYFKDQTTAADPEITMDFQLEPEEAQALITTKENGGNALLVQNKKIAVLNSHTFSQADLDRAGEVLLSPNPLGLLDLSAPFAGAIRQVFGDSSSIKMDAPSRIALQTMEDGSFMIQNYNQDSARINLHFPKDARFVDQFTGDTLSAKNKLLEFTLSSRAHLWAKKVKE